MTQYVSTMETMRTIVGMIQEKKPGMYLRYGDGDFNIASGKDDMLAIATPIFQHWMKESNILDGGISIEYALFTFLKDQQLMCKTILLDELGILTHINNDRIFAIY